MKILLEALVLLLLQGVAIPRLNTGSVSGRLLSIDGSPVSEVRVAAMEADPTSANPDALLAITKTDKDGRYRLENIPPGRFFIVAGLLEYPTFYPGAATRTDATLVQVLSGQIVEKADFSIAEFKVSGKLSGPVRPVETIVLLGSTLASKTEALVSPDGTFEFLKVQRGRYSLQIASGGQRLNFVVDGHDVTGIELAVQSGICVSGRTLTGQPGVRVSGKVEMPGASPSSMPIKTIMLREYSQASGPVIPPPSAVPVQGLLSGICTIPRTSRHTQNRGDGSFEFLNLPPGTYEIEIEPGGGPALFWHFLVADKEINGLQLALRYQVDVPVHVVVEGENQSQISPTKRIAFQGTNNGGTSSIGGTAKDGSFHVILTEGKTQIIVNLPLGYSVKSMVSGAIDMLQNPITIAPGQKFEDIVLTLVPFQ